MTEDNTQSAARSKFRVFTGSVFGLLAVFAAIASIWPPNSALVVEPVAFTIAIVLGTMAIAFAFLVPSSEGVEHAR